MSKVYNEIWSNEKQKVSIEKQTRGLILIQFLLMPDTESLLIL